MEKLGKSSVYDLEDRTLNFAKRVICYANNLPKILSNIEIGRQLVRAAGSVGANYIEANEALGKKDFFMHVRISRKEAKESRYWICLSEPKEDNKKEKEVLAGEATELLKIFNAIAMKAF